MKAIRFVVGLDFRGYLPDQHVETDALYYSAAEVDERIKALEDALKKISAWNFDWNLDTVDIARDIASAALKVKP
jgi:hypothetical protein